MHIYHNVTLTMTSNEEKYVFCDKLHKDIETEYLRAVSAHDTRIDDLDKAIKACDVRASGCDKQYSQMSATNKTPETLMSSFNKLELQMDALLKLEQDVEKLRVKCAQAKASLAESEANFAKLVTTGHEVKQAFRRNPLRRMKMLVSRHKVLAKKFEGLSGSESRAVASVQLMITHMPFISKFQSIKEETKEVITDVSWGTVILPLVCERLKKKCETKEALALLRIVKSENYHVVEIDKKLSVASYETVE